MKTYSFVKSLLSFSVILLTLSGCSNSDPTPSDFSSDSDLQYTIGSDMYKMFSVADDIWDNQSDGSLHIKLHFVKDPSFADKKTNSSIMLEVERLKNPGTFMLGGENGNRIVFIENGLENIDSYDTFWESTSGMINITEIKSGSIKGTFDGILVKKKYVNYTAVVVTGSDMEVKHGEFLVRL